MLEIPELNTVMHVGPHESRAEEEDHLHPPASYVSFDAAQDRSGKSQVGFVSSRI